MSVLDSLDFQPMFITDLFVPHKGRRLIAAHRQEGSTPFVGGSEQNNSITGFSDVAPLFPGGWLTLVYNGSVGHTRLQPVPFFASDDVIALEPRDGDLTKAALLACAAIIQRECVNKYSYGSKLNLQRLKRQTILVPVTTDENNNQVVDWGGLDRLGAELFNQVIASADNVRQTDPDDDATLPDLQFEPMLITQVFTKHRQAPAWLNTNQVKIGDRQCAHVTNSEKRNSVSGFIAQQDALPNAGNAITIGIDTQVVGYQPAPFYGATKVYELRAPNLSELNAPILMASLRKALDKFSWGHKASAKRLEKTHIMVPVTTDEHGDTVVDWEGMTAYGRALRVRAERSLTPVLES